MKKLFFSLFLISMSFFLGAEQVIKNGFVFEIEDDYAILTGYSGSEEKLSVPGTINKIPVKKIGEKAFSGNRLIKTISLGPNVVEICDEAFAGCENLTTVYIRNIDENHIFGKNCFYGSDKARVRFVPYESKVAKISNPPERETMVFVEGNDKVKSFYMDKFEMDEKTYQKIMDNFDAEGFFPCYAYIYEAIIFCNKLSLSEGRTPCYSFAKTTNPDEWDGSRFMWLTTKWSDSDGMIHRAEGFKCDLNADGYRIPTQEEWLYAARGGKNPNSFKYAGADDLNEVAINSNVANQVQKGGRMAPNKLGIYDLSGNLSELCFLGMDGEKPLFGYFGGNLDRFHPDAEKKNMRIDSEAVYEKTEFTDHTFRRGFRVVCTAN